MKSQKGITLIALIITVVVLIILTFTVTINIDKYDNQNKKSNFETDIRMLKEEIDQYYAREKKLPIINKYSNSSLIPNEVKNVNDNDNYYVIDLDEINLEQFSVEISYGRDYDIIKEKAIEEEITDLLDVYIINEQSHTIYYPKGIEYNGQIHYTTVQEYTNIDDNIIKYLQENKIYVTTDMEVKDSLGNRVVIPTGFKIAEDSALTVDNGIVIEDNDIKVGIGNNRRKSICMGTSRKY